MLQIHCKYSELIKDIFQNDQEFLSALDKACSTAINHRTNTKVPCRSPELVWIYFETLKFNLMIVSIIYLIKLAKYCDSLLRKSSKEYTENEIDDKLLSCITIFKYLDDKDYFHKFFHKMLSRRLIGFLSFSMYAEENMINRLRVD